MQPSDLSQSHSASRPRIRTRTGDPLAWNTYRDRSQAPVPVLQVDVVRNYRLDQRLEPENEKLEVEPFVEAVGAFTGETWSDQDWLPAKSLGREPVRILPKSDRTRTTKWVWAETKFDRPDLFTYYDEPVLLPGEQALLVPEFHRNASLEKPTYRRARTRGGGVFEISPGFRKLQGVLVNGDPHAFSGFDYDPRHGTFYIEESYGEPMPSGVNVEVFVDRADSMRVDLEATEPGEVPITVGRPERTVSVLHHRRIRKMEDVRRLPAPDESKRWHAVDWAHYDGRPFPEGMMWIIRTSADREEVEEATDRVMPAGTIYRIDQSSQEDAFDAADPDTGGQKLAAGFR